MRRGRRSWYKVVTDYKNHDKLKHLAVVLSTKSLWTDVYIGKFSFSIKSVILACADKQSSSVDKPEVFLL